LHKAKKIAQIISQNNQLLLDISKKHGSEREHKAYWRIVKNYAPFQNSPMFTLNEDDDAHVESDSGHRNIANYLDHVDGFPAFRVLDDVFLKDRFRRLSDFEVQSAPIPRKDHYPDLDYVQLIAFHRIALFRYYLDSVLGISNSFWKKCRNPTWSSNYLVFQTSPSSFLSTVLQSIQSIQP
jgi:hypothetical protein